MKFDYVIGNPPYQDETLGDNKGFAPPVYNKFLDASYGIKPKAAVCMGVDGRLCAFLRNGREE